MIEDFLKHLSKRIIAAAANAVEPRQLNKMKLKDKRFYFQVAVEHWAWSLPLK